ncbi:MAG: hypothetical protein FWG02_03535 [Holophagaceae bacterium]|nr:hypothetical protein [Holophagaceae bacterium]
MKISHYTKNTQAGGTTILVVLCLLVLLTVAALSMSKNSFREIQTGGFLRQGAMTKNVSDSGIEWTIYWIDLQLIGTSSSTEPGHQLINLATDLLADSAKSGRAYALSGADYKVGKEPWESSQRLDSTSTFTGFDGNNEMGFEMGFNIGLTRMGKLPVANMSQGAGAGSYTPAAGGSNLQAPDLWAIRSDALVRPETSAITFTHGREAWVSTPVRVR